MYNTIVKQMGSLDVAKKIRLNSSFFFIFSCKKINEKSKNGFDIRIYFLKYVLHVCPVVLSIFSICFEF